jgi:2-keto-4-pentenoate hydratase
VVELDLVAGEPGGLSQGPARDVGYAQAGDGHRAGARYHYAGRLTAIHPRIVTALQAQLRRRPAGAQRVGWKAGYGIEEVEALIGSTPVPGHLTTATLVGPAATIRCSHADVEVVVTVGSDQLGVALELVDLARPPGGVEALVESNVMHRGFVLGPTGTTPGEARLVVNGEVRAAAPARADHRATVEGLARVLEAVGERLEPGDRILTGSVVQVPVAPGDHVVAEIDGLGCAETTLNATAG